MGARSSWEVILVKYFKNLKRMRRVSSSPILSSTNQLVKHLLIGTTVIVICFCFTLILTSIRLRGSSNCRKTNNDDPKMPKGDEPGSSFKIQYDSVHQDHEHKLGVIIPFRDCFDELRTFIPFIHTYLNFKNINHQIFVVNQVDNYRFNRASLVNVGFLYSTNPQNVEIPVDYIVMHDVDLLPLNNHLPYHYPNKTNSVVHIIGPGLHPEVNFPKYIGGILIVPVPVYGLVNGMSNIYWGWGLEDDEFYTRLEQHNIIIIRPKGLKTDKTNTFKHIHSDKKRPRDQIKCYNQYNKTRRKDRRTGLSNVNYTIESISSMKIEDAPLILLNVKLHCDLNVSPWCDCGININNNNNSSSRNVLRRKNLRKITERSNESNS